MTDARPGDDRACSRGRKHPNAWWALHNLVAHPVSEVAWWLRLRRFGDWLHDATVPEHARGDGRG